MLLPDDSAELQALCAKAGQELQLERIELAALGNEGISYRDIRKYDAVGKPTKELACRVGFGKDKGKSKQDSDSQGDTHDES